VTAALEDEKALSMILEDWDNRVSEKLTRVEEERKDEIEFDLCILAEHDTMDLPKERKEFKIQAVLGLIKTSFDVFHLTVVKQCSLVCEVTTDKIMVIEELEFLPLSRADSQDKLEAIHAIFKDNMFFSTTMDLTSNQRRSAFQNRNKLNHGKPIWALADDRYFWNYNMAAPYFFMNPRVTSSWVPPVI
jgi:hypothetical protein